MALTAHNVLNHHGIGTADMTDDQLTDAARAAGVAHICLGCGTVCTVPEGTPEDVRKLFGMVYDFSCCGDGIVY